MHPLTASLAPVFAVGSASLGIGAVIWIVLGVLCAAIPLVAGVARGHIALGVIGAILTIPVAAFGFGCLGALPVAALFTVIIKLVPVPERPLLTQAEVEKEMERARGY
jgi:hypothetical protein